MTTFSKDTGTTFGEDKCAYQQVENGKLIKNTEDLKINNFNIQPVKDSDTYKYLGIDENISYVGTVINSNDRIFNQGEENLAFRTNTFAIPVLTNTVGIIDWTIEKIKQM